MYRNAAGIIGKGFAIIAMAASLALPAMAEYAIFVKGVASPILAKDKPEIRGGYYYFQDLAGNNQKLKIDDIDETKTKAHSEAGLGGSYALPGQSSTLQAIAQPKKAGSDLGKIAREKRGEIKDATAVFFKETGPTPEALERTAHMAAKETPGTAPNSPLVEAFIRTLETAGIRGAKVSEIPNGVRIQASTETEQQVFSAVGAVARGLKELRTQGKNLDRADLALNTSAGENAGRFVITPEDSESLLTGKISAAKWFVANVQF